MRGFRDALTCNTLKQATNIEDALPHDALETHTEDCEECHDGQYEDGHGEEYNRGLPESTGDLTKVGRVGSTLDVAVVIGHLSAAGVKAQYGAVGPRGEPKATVGSDGPAGRADQPIIAHESDELSERHHDAQQSP